MLEQIFDGQNPKRRIVSMLGKNFSRIKYIFFLALLLVVPVKAWGGGANIGGTDGLSSQLISVWDLRARNSFVQVTNTGPNLITVHVQIFNVVTGCSDSDFYDTFTPNDTHVYNLRNITGNIAQLPPINLPDGGFGIVVITNVAGVDGGALGSLADFVLTGNFRIIDNAGYEYRSNSEGVPNLTPTTFNFNNVDGANASDVIGIPLAQVGTGFVEVIASGPFITFDVNLFDAIEQVFSCDDFTFRCTPTNFNVGISGALPNSRGAATLCPAFGVNTGFVRLDIELTGTGGGINFFTGFIGLNNGDGTGSMDTWWLDATNAS